MSEGYVKKAAIGVQLAIDINPGIKVAQVITHPVVQEMSECELVRPAIAYMDGVLLKRVDRPCAILFHPYAGRN